MDSEVSSEKPKGLLIRQVAERIRAARDEGARVLLVCRPRRDPHRRRSRPGPPGRARLDRACLFTGNGFATHDIESNVLGTSLGVGVADGVPVEGGHANHLRVINEIRRHGSIAAAVEAGYVTGGVMHACVRADVPFVLGGSVRDDGPLPDTMTDVVAAADAMRAEVPGVQVALMLATDAARHRHRQRPARRPSRRSASTSTRRSSPSSPTGAATRRSASSPTSAPSSASSPTSSAPA